MHYSPISFQVRRTYSEHHARCHEILNAASVKLSPRLKLELHAVMYVISDFAAFGYEHNRQPVSDALLSKIIPTLSAIHPQFTPDIFRKRVVFYSQVIDGLVLHAHGLAGRDVSDAHPVIRCAVAFSDCCLNPAYIESYDAPCPMFSALDVFHLCSGVMEPISKEFASLYKEIGDISALPAPVPRPVPSPATKPSAQKTAPPKNDSDVPFMLAYAAIATFAIILFLVAHLI